MEFGELKPLLKALFFPPAGLLLLAGVGVLLGLRRRVAGAIVSVTALAALWLLACQGVGIALMHALLPPVAPASEAQLRTVQAIVVLGGGVDGAAPEYPHPQPDANVLARVRYAALLARRAGKPVALSAGVGWGADGSDSRRMPMTEAETMKRMLAGDYGVETRWLEDRSRDTRENARFSAAMLHKDGVRRIALVTDALHMPRSVRNFREAGFEVVPAPTNFPDPTGGFAMQWLPTPQGLRTSRYVLQEWFGIRLT